MAGDWIKMEKDTLEKPEVLAMSSILGITPEETFGRCFRLWRWADSHTKDGFIQHVSADKIDAISGCAGFANALIEVGWLHVRSGALELPHFARHMGQPAKQRALTSNRVRRNRVTKVKRKCNAPSSLLFSSLSIPLFLRGDVFESALKRWFQFRSEIKHPMTKTQAEALMKKFEEWGPERAVKAIDYTIEKGWRGLREPEEGRAAKGGGESAVARYVRELKGGGP